MRITKEIFGVKGLNETQMLSGYPFTCKTPLTGGD